MGERDELSPINVTDDLWCYTEPRHVTVVHRIYHSGQYLRTDQIRIPSRLIVEMADFYRRPPRQK